MPHRKLEFEIGNRTPNCLRHHVWLDVSTFNKCLFTTKQGGFLLILICETSQIFVWRNKAFIFSKRVTSYLSLGHNNMALRRECRFNTSFLSPLFLKLRKTFLTFLIVPNTRCFHATLTCWTSTSRFKT